MFEIIAFDADDTLWDNEIYYIQAKQEFIKLLASYDNDVEWIERRLDEIEEGNVEIYGYGIKSFTLSMIEAAIEFSRGVISGDELEKIIYIGRRMLNTRVRLFPHTEQVLQELDKKWRLMLITKGDVFEQSLKIERTGLKEYFRYIEIVGAKTASIYNTVFERCAQISCPSWSWVAWQFTSLMKIPGRMSTSSCTTFSITATTNLKIWDSCPTC
jgi:putative hydrolase of the HAD superfamily